MVSIDWSLGSFGDERLDKRGGLLLERMVAGESACLRRAARGARDLIVGFNRFLANKRVTAEGLIEGWGLGAAQACAGGHVLAIQDTSEINFHTNGDRQRGLGKIGKGGRARGLLLHAMLGVDADSGGLLGLVTGRIWTRTGLVATSRAKRALSDKESERWVSTPEAAKSVLAGAVMVTEISDREADLYVKWARVPGAGFHVLTRMWHDRSIVEGGTLSTAMLRSAGMAVVEDLRERPGRPERQAHLMVRYGQVTLKRPDKIAEKGLAEHVRVSLVEVAEENPPAGAEPVFWRLLTTHPVETTAMAWQVVGWYRKRWIIEQFFRTLKQQGLQLEDSQVESAERLVKLTAIAARAACAIMQLVQARDGVSGQMASLIFTPDEIETLHALVPQLEGKTALQKNPHPPGSLAWASWAIGKLGGWDGYPKSTPPGPITFKHGLNAFYSIAHGWALRRLQKDV
ncbi:MAG TPA: IS4 family transposase [Caulobacteraceae bacterium]